MKIAILTIHSFLFSYLGIQFNWLPQTPTLLAAVACAMALDLLTGMVKAKLNDRVRSSKMLRETLKKFIQYFTAIVITIGLQYLCKNIDAESLAVVKYITRCLLVFIILIEIFSCCENIYDVDKTSPFSKYLITPILKILSLGFKNNPVVKAADAADAAQNKTNEITKNTDSIAVDNTTLN
jgi:Kef-type K+ transport system membrane component KefB